MKRDLERNEENLFLRASENLALFLEQPYKIMNEFIETENFVPEAFVIHQFQRSDNSENAPLASLELLGTSQLDCGILEASYLSQTDSLLAVPKNSEGNGDGDEDDKDWDEDDDDWDEDEDFDEDEEWDEDDEEWDEDEDWDEDDDEEGDDDWEEGEEEK